MAVHSHIEQLQADAAVAARRVTDLEQALQVSLERYELIWQATHDILYDLDIASGTVTWNQALYDQFGYAMGEPSGTLEWWVAHIHPDDALAVERGLYEWFESQNNTWRTEYRFRTADGGYRYVLDRGYLIRGAGQQPLRIIGTLLDITPQKELDQAKDEFISLVSHQLRTPLTVIRVYGEMFAGGMFGQLTPTQAQHVARMTSASVRLIKLVDDILHVSRVELGDYAADRIWLDADDVLEQAVTALQPLASDKHITLQHISSTLPLVYTDREILTHILENILTNAVRYTPAGRGRITATCTRSESELIISVADNGIGIPKAAQGRVFDRFYRAHNAINIEEHGTGLGLYLVHIFAGLLGGRVWLNSTYRKGSTFYLALPLA